MTEAMLMLWASKVNMLLQNTLMFFLILDYHPEVEAMMGS